MSLNIQQLEDLLQQYKLCIGLLTRLVVQMEQSVMMKNSYQAFGTVFRYYPPSAYGDQLKKEGLPPELTYLCEALLQKEYAMRNSAKPLLETSKNDTIITRLVPTKPPPPTSIIADPGPTKRSNRPLHTRSRSTVLDSNLNLDIPKGKLIEKEMKIKVAPLEEGELSKSEVEVITSSMDLHFNRLDVPAKKKLTEKEKIKVESLEREEGPKPKLKKITGWDFNYLDVPKEKVKVEPLEKKEEPKPKLKKITGWDFNYLDVPKEKLIKNKKMMMKVEPPEEAELPKSEVEVITSSMDLNFNRLDVPAEKKLTEKEKIKVESLEREEGPKPKLKKITGWDFNYLDVPKEKLIKNKKMMMKVEPLKKEQAPKPKLKVKGVQKIKEIETDKVQTLHIPEKMSSIESRVVYPKISLEQIWRDTILTVDPIKNDFKTSSSDSSSEDESEVPKRRKNW